MRNKDSFTCFCAFLIAIGWLFASITIMSNKLNKIKQDAVIMGYAQHNPISGNWEWITNKTDKK